MNHVTTVLDDELAKTLRPALRCFAQHDSSVDDRGFIGNTALHFAAKRGYEKTAAMLLLAGADPNRQSVSGETRALSSSIASLNCAFDLSSTDYVRTALLHWRCPLAERVELTKNHHLCLPFSRTLGSDREL